MSTQTFSMNCPICQQPMELRKQDISYTKNQAKFYDRHFFVCRQDDVWLRLELPQHQPEHQPARS